MIEQLLSVAEEIVGETERKGEEELVKQVMGKKYEAWYRYLGNVLWIELKSWVIGWATAL